MPLAARVLLRGARLHERTQRFLDEERIPAGARDDPVAQLVGDPIEGRFDDARGLLVRERFEHELREVRARRLRLRRARSEALREQEQDRHTRGARGEEPQEVERRRVGEVQVLEDVKQGMLPRERCDHVVHDDVHRTLPFLRVARRLAHAGQMEELRERRRDHQRIREAQLLELLADPCDAVHIRRLHAQLDEDRLDEARVAPLVHARERPAHHARGVGGLRALLGGGGEADELRREPALSDARLAGDEHDLGAAEARGLVGEVEAGELHPATDERRRDLDARPDVGALSDKCVGEDRLVLALQLDRADLTEAELAVGQAESGLRDVDLGGSCHGLEARRDVHGIAHHAVLRDAADRARDDHAGMDADAQAELDAALLLHARGVVGEDALHRERGAERPLRVVLVRDGRTEYDEDRVADELLDGPVVPDRLLGEILEDARHQDLQLLGIHLVGELGESGEVGEEHRHETALLRLLL